MSARTSTPAPSGPVILPRVPSALLRIAVADCMLVELMPDRVLDMGVYFVQAGARTRCRVCMAGAVMDRRLGAGESDCSVALPSYFPENEAQLRAIDSLRKGDLEGACYALGPLPFLQASARAYTAAIIADFNHELGRASWETYLTQADALEAAGL